MTKGRNIRVDKIMAHCKSEHPEAARDASRSLLSFGFTREGGRVTAPLLSVAYEGRQSHDVAPGSGAFGEHDASASLLATATVERNMVSSNVNVRAFAQQVDAVIKANSAAQVIPIAKAIAEELLRQQDQKHTEQRGTGVFRELW